MTILNNYSQFSTHHWETGTIKNYLEYRGFLAEHNKKPYSEALLMGISGGLVMGYFSFAYKGYDPHVVILTRNTFDPLDTLLSRLGVEQELKHTGIPEKGYTNLVDTLDNGLPAIIWADMYSLPHNTLPLDDGMWGMAPIIVYGIDESRDEVWIADRAEVPLKITVDQLAAARSRVKKDKYRILTISEPNPKKIKLAVEKGIWDSIKLYTEKPPKGAANNFGYLAYQRFSDILTNPKARMSWAKEFPVGAKLFAGLSSTFTSAFVYGKKGESLDAERLLFADFLKEATVILEKPGLAKAVSKMEKSAASWKNLAMQIFPDGISLLKESRELILEKDLLFRKNGSKEIQRMKEVNSRLDEIKELFENDYPLSDNETEKLLGGIAEAVMSIHDMEKEAIDILQEEMVK
ncbi:MAG: hypothetical protein HOF10_06285 [Chloroflexi bacterium]|nr:hypothetical protein [Chloroflexota bacterium]